MKTTFVQAIIFLSVVGTVLFSSCGESSTGIIDREDVVFDSISGKMLTPKKRIPITGTVVEEWLLEGTDETLVRRIEVNEGKVMGVTDVMENGEVFRNYRHKMQIHRGAHVSAPTQRLFFLSENMKDTACVYHADMKVSRYTDYIFLNDTLVKTVTTGKGTVTIADKIQKTEKTYESDRLVSFKDLKTNLETFYDYKGGAWKRIKYSAKADTTYEYGKLVQIDNHEKKTRSEYKNGKLVLVIDNIKRTESIYENGVLVRTKKQESVWQELFEKSPKEENIGDIIVYMYFTLGLIQQAELNLRYERYDACTRDIEKVYSRLLTLLRCDFTSKEKDIIKFVFEQVETKKENNLNYAAYIFENFIAIWKREEKKKEKQRFYGGN